MRFGKELEQRQAQFREQRAKKAAEVRAAKAQQSKSRYSREEQSALNRRMWRYLRESERRLQEETEYNRLHAIPTTWKLIEQVAEFHGLWQYEDSQKLLGLQEAWGRKKDRRDNPAYVTQKRIQEKRPLPETKGWVS